MKMKEPCKSFNYGAEIRELELEERRIAIKKAKLEILERELALTERAYALSQKKLTVIIHLPASMGVIIQLLFPLSLKNVL